MEQELVAHTRRRRPSAACTAAALLVLLFLCGGCGTYHVRSTEIKRSFAQSDYEDALVRVEEIDLGTSELLYLYEKGLILHYGDDYAASNEAFERAEMLLEELYTKSVTRELAALALTDNVTKYRGASYEAVLVNYYKILNYVYLGDVEGALVECRRVNRKLEYLRDAEDVFFVDDPFIQFLTGMVYRLSRELNDADVSFRVALEGYEVLGADYGVDTPGPLRCDALETAMQLGDSGADSLALNCPDGASDSTGTLNLFLECGYVAHLQERKIVLPIFKDDDVGDTDAFAEVLAAREGVASVDYRSNKKVDYVLKGGGECRRVRRRGFRGGVRTDSVSHHHPGVDQVRRQGRRFREGRGPRVAGQLVQRGHRVGGHAHLVHTAREDPHVATGAARGEL
jgi:tetratricopeptide (TPR) repeat protein